MASGRILYSPVRESMRPMDHIAGDHEDRPYDAMAAIDSIGHMGCPTQNGHTLFAGGCLGTGIVPAAGELGKSRRQRIFDLFHFTHPDGPDMPARLRCRVAGYPSMRCARSEKASRRHMADRPPPRAEKPRRLESSENHPGHKS